MYEQTLKYISNFLLKGDIDVSSSGLLHGKMGLVVFLFHYARHTGNKLFENHAMELMDNIQEQILQQHDIHYADGLAGIGTAVEYLVQNNFVEADTNEILEEFDKKIFRKTVYGDHEDVNLETGLSGLGRYFLFRVTGHYTNDNQIGTLNNKMSLIHITDTFDRMCSSFNRTEVKDVLGFLYAMNQTNIYPAKVKRLIELLISGSQSSSQDDITQQHQIKITAFYNSKYNELLSNFQENTQPNIVPGLFGGLAGIGLHVLSKIEKQHATWMNLL